MKKKRLNKEITARTVQLISDEWENLWKMSIDEARQIASDKELDMLEISDKWEFSIVKLLDYWKYLYSQKKQKQKNKIKGKVPDLKTIRITYRISEHDLEVKKKMAEGFAKWGHPIKVMLTLKKRENKFGEIARKKILNFIDMLEWIYKVENPPQRSGHSFIANLVPEKSNAK